MRVINFHIIIILLLLLLLYSCHILTAVMCSGMNGRRVRSKSSSFLISLKYLSLSIQTVTEQLYVADFVTFCNIAPYINSLTYLLRSKYAAHSKYFRSLSSRKNLVGISTVVFYRRLGIHMTRHRAIMWKHDVIYKTGSTYRNANTQSEKGNMHKNLANFGRAVFELCERTDKKWDKHADEQTYSSQ